MAKKRKKKMTVKQKMKIYFIVTMTIVLTLLAVGVHKYFTEIKPERENMISNFLNENGVLGTLKGKNRDGVYVFMSNEGEEYRIYLDRVVWYEAGNIKKVEKVNTEEVFTASKN